MTKNHWSCVDTHFWHGAGSESLLFLPLMVATITFMDVCNKWPVKLPRCNLKYCWTTVLTHHQDGAGSVSLLFMTQKAVSTSFVDVVNQSPPRLHKMERQKSLTFCWLLFLKWGSDYITFCFAHEGCEYVSYILLQPNHFSIIMLTRLNIDDALFMLIVMYGLFKISCHQ